MADKVTAYISNVKPFQVAVVAFVTMLLVAVGTLITSIIAVTKTHDKKALMPLLQAHAMAAQAKAVSAAQAVQIAHLTHIHHMTRKFLDGQYGVLILSAIVIVLALAGLTSASMVVSDVGESGGTTNQDYMWLSSLGSIVLGQGILLMVVAIFSTVEYKAVRQATVGVKDLDPQQKTLSRYLMAELILGYIGLIGGIVFYASMRTSKK
jgi:hypothetical protein